MSGPCGVSPGANTAVRPIRHHFTNFLIRRPVTPVGDGLLTDIEARSKFTLLGGW